MTLAEDKARTRAEARQARDGAHGAGAGDAVAAALTDALRPYRGRPLAGYLPIRSEADPVSAMAEMAGHGLVGVPKVTGKDEPLTFLRWYPSMELNEGAFGVMVPSVAEPMVPEIVIVPMLAFDARGYRLGYGGGFYDRTLERLRQHGPVLAIGLAFAAQERTDLPIDANDQPLDAVVTEMGLRWFTEAGSDLPAKTGHPRA